MTFNKVRVEANIGGKNISLETGQIARQAHGSVLVTLGQTEVFSGTVQGPLKAELDFFPLTVDYREQTQAAGKIPGGFFKREGRPTTKEILTMRLTDRSIRPMFPDNFRREVQVYGRAFGYDGENNADVLSMVGCFASLGISNIPFMYEMGAVRVGLIDGELVAFPTEEQRKESELDLVLAGTAEAICMVESSAKQLSEEQMLDALEFGHKVIAEVCALVKEFKEKAGKDKDDFVAPAVNEELTSAIAGHKAGVAAALKTEGKKAAEAAKSAHRESVLAELTAGMEAGDELSARIKEIKTIYHDLENEVAREAVIAGRRSDGRGPTDIRQITVDPDIITRNHGSVLFTRGETQALVSTTLGTPEDEMIIDGIDEEYRKSFYLHYSFPSYSVGETRRMMGPGRREIGHGMLAERALTPVVPENAKFPYTIRIVSEITESNGSSSMASVCGGCLSMMLAGVPIAQPVAGIAMGLVKEGDDYVVLSDILGSEDHFGDMDFKVAGTGLGITALQMDIKVKGLSRQILEEALAQANAGRKHILREMLAVVDRPRAEVSEQAPTFAVLKIPAEKIGFLIGPGGKNIRAMQEEYKARISIMDEEGNIKVFGLDGEKVKKCAAAISGMCESPGIGARYTGVVKATRDFGAFIEILPGVEGLCHISELAEGFVDKVEDIVKPGDEIEVVVINVDDRGKIKLSHKQTLEAAAAE
ncbi:MAG: polyribonucleotide nucleotidyltransferase [Planctomycetota bacterium]|nr:polyribonucleotide nucleotidyltransferase [Planctomycetota bacterium]MDG2144573.1 polyribonucleotide nucleotidyltransferase [Planctomycetota bacterium]